MTREGSRERKRRRMRGLGCVRQWRWCMHGTARPQRDGCIQSAPPDFASPQDGSHRQRCGGRLCDSDANGRLGGVWCDEARATSATSPAPSLAAPLAPPTAHAGGRGTTVPRAAEPPRSPAISRRRASRDGRPTARTGVWRRRAGGYHCTQHTASKRSTPMAAQARTGTLFPIESRRSLHPAHPSDPAPM